MTISMFLMLFNTWAGILIVMMLFMTFGEMFAFPFSNSFAMSRAPKGHEGRYMAIFTMSYSLAHITSAKLGMEIIEYFSPKIGNTIIDHQAGYQANWVFMGCLGLISVFLGIWVYRLTIKEPQRVTN